MASTSSSSSKSSSSKSSLSSGGRNKILFLTLGLIILLTTLATAISCEDIRNVFELRHLAFRYDITQVEYFKIVAFGGKC